MKKHLLKLKVFACSASLLIPLVGADNYGVGETKAVVERESSYTNQEVEIETTYTAITTQPVTTTEKVLVGYKEEKYISGYIEKQYIKEITDDNVTVYDVKKVPVYSTRIIPVYEEIAYSLYKNEKDFDSSSETVCTTTGVTTTTPVTTTEPIDEYKHIRNLEKLNNNDLSIEELDLFINKYAGYTKLSYDDALKVINDNIDSIESDYLSIRGGIMVTLFNHSNEIGLLSPYTCDREIREDMTQEEKESIMLEFCDNFCMSNDDKAITLAAFREETGRGTSYMCVQNNNYGGIRIYGEAGCNGEYGMYSTPEFGMYREVSLINKKLTAIRGEGTSELSSVVYSFACRYNPDHADQYSGKILNWVYDVYNDYGDFSNTTSKEKVYK